MTGITAVVGIIRSTVECVVMTVGTVGGGNRHNTGMIRGGGMGSRPRTGMTGGTVTRCGLARSKANEPAGCSIMTGITAVVGIIRRTVKRVVMTVSTVGGGHSHNAGMIRGSGMGSRPRTGMTGSTITRR